MPPILRMLSAALVLIAGQIAGAQAADPNHGAELARRWCAACHVVSPSQQRGADAVPTFESIARRSEFSSRALAFFLLDPHPKMPDMALSRPEADDLAAYIESLRRR
jgi:mono/diheme cytochrome c family protein